jgi:hypothetical protein
MDIVAVVACGHTCTTDDYENGCEQPKFILFHIALCFIHSSLTMAMKERIMDMS